MAAVSLLHSVQSSGLSADGFNGDEDTNPLQHHPIYKKLSDLTRPQVGHLLLAQNVSTEETVVIKLVERGLNVKRNVQKELLMHRSFYNHPNFVQLRDVFLTQAFLAIVMEYTEGRDLEAYIAKCPSGKLPEEEARCLFQQLVIALDAYHRRGAYNREIKMDNLLLVHGKGGHATLKMADFTYSKNEQVNSDPRTALATLAYTAPEVLMQSKYDGRSSDIWACGIVLFYMLAGRFPFEREEDRDSTRRVQRTISRIMAVEYDLPSQASPLCIDLLKKILVSNPDHRATLADVIEHPWFGVDLKPNAFVLNNSLPPPPPTIQSEAELQQIVAEASEPLRQESENIDELADEELDQQEMEDLLDDFSL